MAVLGKAEITISYIIDIAGTTRYYIVYSSDSFPDTPTDNPPTGWSDIEPDFDATTGAGKSLYFVDCTVFTDNTFKYSKVSKSISYESIEKVTSELKLERERITANVEATNQLGTRVSAVEQTAEGLTSRVTNTEGSVSQLQQQADSWEVKISQVAGRNLFRNTVRYTEHSPFTAINSSPMLFDGKAIYTDTSFKIGDKITLQGVSNFPWTETADYNLRVGKVGFYIGFGTFEQVSKGTCIVGGLIIGDGISKHLKSTYIIPDLTKFGVPTENIHILFQFENEFTNGSAASVWNIKLETGDTATPWSPAYEDIYISGDDIISKINLTASTATIQASKINLSGYITASDLAGNGTTVINGSNITTGTIKANYLDLNGARIGGWYHVGTRILSSPSLYMGAKEAGIMLIGDDNGNKRIFIQNDNGEAMFEADKYGRIIAKDADIYGSIKSNDITAKNMYYIHSSSGVGTRRVAISAPDGSFGNTLTVGEGFNTLYLKGLIVNPNSGGAPIIAGEDGSWKVQAGGYHTYTPFNGAWLDGARGNVAFNLGNPGNSGDTINGLARVLSINGAWTLASLNKDSCFNIYYMSNDRISTNQNVVNANFRFSTNGTLTTTNLQIDGETWIQDWSRTNRRPVCSVTGDLNRVAAMGSYSNRLSVIGQWQTPSYSTYNISVSSSDQRLKSNIIPSNINAMSAINKMQISEFDWTDGRHQKIGFVADQLETIDPELAMGGGYLEDGSMDIKCVNDFYMLGYIVKGMQEMYQDKKMKDVYMENKLNSILSRFEVIEERLRNGGL